MLDDDVLSCASKTDVRLVNCGFRASLETIGELDLDVGEGEPEEATGDELPAGCKGAKATAVVDRSKTITKAELSSPNLAGNLALRNGLTTKQGRHLANTVSEIGGAS